MDHQRLAQLLFPDITTTPEDIEKMYPPRNLPEGAKVTRMAPSPTGFMHLGNLFSAIVGERLAHQSNGVFFLRIEDTDLKRAVEGGVEKIINVFNHYGLNFDEGATIDGDNGAYGPYRQRQRANIYQTFAKQLVERGLAYPCFCTEEELTEMREKQQEMKINFGYYGEWAKCRNLSFEEIEANIKAGKPYVLRFRSEGDPNKRFTHHDLVKGDIELPENDQDIVLLKSDGIPTYHFAHVVDDHLMQTTHVVRGEEWLATLNIHLQLFRTMGWKAPKYVHTAQLMKMDGGSKRKLSKRKDPELSLDYYRNEGYHPAAVREYLLTILNSNFEEWRIANPDADIDEFAFTTEKMSNSGALFDLNKLNDISKDVLLKIPAEELFDFLKAWSDEFKPELAPIFEDRAYLEKILDIGRHEERNPRKDHIYAQQIIKNISYFFDDMFEIEDEFPQEASGDVPVILSKYLETYNHADDQEAWFGKIREITAELGYAVKPKDFKKNPDQYKGHVGHVSTVIRVALMGRQQSPDVWEIQQILGEERTRARLAKFI